MSVLALENGGIPMEQFELRFLDRLEVPIIVRAYIAQDDLAALNEAERLCKTHAIEVWHGDWRVARVKKGNAALVPEDRQVL
jgi:hypothetical protein